MAIDDDDDKRPRVRMGRFSDADERIVNGIMGRWFIRCRTSGAPRFGAQKSRRRTRDSTLPGRAMTQALGHDVPYKKEVVIKCRSCPKSLYATKTLIRYVARLRERDKRDGEYGSIPLWDEYGMSVSTDEAVVLTETWELTPDEDNLSKAAREHMKRNDLAALHAMKGRDRLYHNQVWHFMFSIKEDGDDDATSDAFCASVRATVDEIFSANGYKVLWALHKGHTDHLHAHVIVRARSEFGRRLSDKVYGWDFHIIRSSFAKHLQSAGLDYTATRRIDRTPLREQIMAGMEPLKMGREVWGRGRDKYAQLQTWAALFGQRALDNIDLLEHVREDVRTAIQGKGGQEKYEAAINVIREKLDAVPDHEASLGQRLKEVFKKPANDTVPSQYADVYEAFEIMYHDPKGAFVSWLHMAGERSHWNEEKEAKYPFFTFAIWNLRRRPEVFGRAKSSAYTFSEDRDFKRMLRHVPLPPPEYFPRLNDEASAFLKKMRTKQMLNDRASVMAQLGALYEQLERGWKDSWWGDVVRKAIRETGCVEIGQNLSTSPRQLNDTQKMVRPNVERETTQNRKSKDQAPPSVPSNENDVGRETKKTMSKWPRPRSKNIRRSR